MVGILTLKAGDQGVVMELPQDDRMKQLLLVHGIHVGGKIKVEQLYTSQQLVLLSHNGRKVALRLADCEALKVAVANG